MATARAARRDSGPRDLPLREICDSVFKTVENDKDVSAQSLASLHFLFDKSFEKAVDILKNSVIKRVVGEKSGREVYQVTSSSKRQSRSFGRERDAGDAGGALGTGSHDEYLVLPFHYCSCHAFQHEVIHKGEMFLCKHIIAARIAKALGMTVTIIVNDTLLAQVLLSM